MLVTAKESVTDTNVMNPQYLKGCLASICWDANEYKSSESLRLWWLLKMQERRKNPWRQTFYLFILCCYSNAMAHLSFFSSTLYCD